MRAARQVGPGVLYFEVQRDTSDNTSQRVPTERSLPLRSARSASRVVHKTSTCPLVYVLEREARLAEGDMFL